MPGLEPTRNSALKIAVMCFPNKPWHLAYKDMSWIWKLHNAIFSSRYNLGVLSILVVTMITK